jgi:hypothetical protein
MYVVYLLFYYPIEHTIERNKNNAEIRLHSKQPYTITKTDGNINIDSTIGMSASGRS